MSKIVFWYFFHYAYTIYIIVPLTLITHFIFNKENTYASGIGHTQTVEVENDTAINLGIDR